MNRRSFFGRLLALLPIPVLKREEPEKPIYQIEPWSDRALLFSLPQSLELWRMSTIGDPKVWELVDPESVERWSKSRSSPR
jgi:hypothetical protein